MATGDIADFVRRLRAALPRRWFPDTSPVLVGMLTGFAAVWARLYDLRSYTILQLRITTATGVFLDIVAQDFFQGRITRNLSEPDVHFRARILAEILRPRATRAAVDQALFDLTGVHPIIFEPSLASDTGGYNTGGLGYNVAGGWGSILLPFQAFITAFRPAGGGISGVSGYGNIGIGIQTTGGIGGYGQGSIEWANLAMIRGAITDSDIYATVAAAMPAATIGWTRGLNAGAATGSPANQLLPAAGFSRSVTQSRGTLSLVAGLLLNSLGRATASGRMQDDARAALRAIGKSAALGRLLVSTSTSSALGAQGVGRAFGRIANLTGGSLLMALSRSNAAGRGVMGGVLPLTARAAAKSFGAILGGGNVIVFNSRSRAMGSATTAISVAMPLAGASRSTASGRLLVASAAALSAIGKSSARGFWLVSASASSLLGGRGVSRAIGRATSLTTTTLLAALSRSSAAGGGVMSGVVSLSALAAAKASGRSLEGNNVILAGRAKAQGSATTAVGASIPLVAAARAEASGRALITGSGGPALAARSKSTAAGRSTAMASTTALSAIGKTTASAKALEGNNVILNGRARALSQAKATIGRIAGLIAAARAETSGRTAAMSLFAGVPLSALGGAVAKARTAASAALPLRGVARSKAIGSGSLVVVQGAPTAPTNLVASNPTPASMDLTWTASLGDQGSNDGSLLNDGGVVILATPPAGYPTSTSGLAAGQVWSNGGVVSVVPGATPNPAAPPVLLNAITAAGLLTLGGGNLPITSPAVNSGQLWNSGGEVFVA